MLSVFRVQVRESWGRRGNLCPCPREEGKGRCFGEEVGGVSQLLGSPVAEDQAQGRLVALWARNKITIARLLRRAGKVGRQ